MATSEPGKLTVILRIYTRDMYSLVHNNRAVITAVELTLSCCKEDIRRC